VFGAAAALVAVVPPAAAQIDETATATIKARYDANVPVSVRTATDFALAIWARRLESAVPIDVDVAWGAGLPRNVAASTVPAGYERVSDDARVPVALANALSGRDLEPNHPDLQMQLGSGIRWYTGTDGNAPANATDMVTMVLHEVAHGLGFADSFRLGDGGLVYGRDGAPLAYDAHIADTTTGALVDAPDAADMFASATSNRIVWRGTARDSHGHAPILYAPRVWEPGSSLTHFDDTAYPQGDPDALLTSLIRRGEVIHRIGPAALGVLRDLGWTVNAEPAAPRAAPTPTTTSTSPTTIVAPVVAALPEVTTRRETATGDVGRAGVSGAGALVPVLAIAAALRRLRNS
jgi:hypothetical protein